MSRHGIVRVAREVFLTSGALLGVVCIVATVAGFAFGIMPLVFRSGSMSPAIHTGDLAIARTVDADTLAVGDVVSVIDSGGNRVTHRVQNVAAQGNARQLTLKGDANQTPDAEVYTVTRAERVLFHVPRAGYAVDAAASPAGLFALGLYVAVMLALVFRRRYPDDPEGPGDQSAPTALRGGARRLEKPRRSRSAGGTVAVVGAAAVLAVGSPAAAASWTDAVAVSGTTLSAYTVPAPVVSCGALAVGSAKLNWTAVPGATEYVLHYAASGATAETVSGSTLSKTFSGVATSGTFTVEARINYGSATWASVPSNAKNYSVLLFLVSTCT
jgi:signal peptidase I